MIEILLWYILISVLGLAVFPVAFRLFPKLADRGYALARPLGILLWTFVFWMLGMLGVTRNDAGSALLALVLVLLLSARCAGGGKLTEIKGWLREHWKTVAVSEVIFLLAFIGWAVVRSADPNPPATEKPMELAFINSILRADGFPPPDPWMSGYGISYYYFGYIMVAMIARITGTVGAVAFNLGVAMWFALTALGAYGILYSLLSAFFGKLKRNGEKQKEGRVSSAPRWLGLLGPLYVLIVSNFEGLLELLHNSGAFWSRAADGTMVSGFWKWINIQSLVEAPVAPFIPQPHTFWWWWHGSRVLSDWRLTGLREEVIDEFPFFTYYLADLHPHLLSMPFVMLAIALAINFFMSGKKHPLMEKGITGWVKTVDFWVTALILGALGPLNIWDFPIYVAFFAAVFVFLRFKQLGWEWKRVWDFLRLLLSLVAGGLLLFLPFYLGFSSQASGLILPSMVFFTEGKHFWIMFGTLLLPILAWLVWLWRQRGTKKSFWNGLKFSAIATFGLWLGMLVLGFVAINLPVIGNVLINPNNPTGLFSTWGARLMEAGNRFFDLQGGTAGEIFQQTFARRLSNPGTWLTLLGLTLLVWGLLSTFKRKKAEKSAAVEAETNQVEEENEEANPEGLVLLLVLLGAGLTLVPEFVYLQDLFFTRMNTIFKFYFQAWIVWALAAAYASVILWNRLRGWKAGLFAVGWSVVLFCGLLIPYWGLTERAGLINISFMRPIQEWTLDESAYLQRTNPDEWQAILWLKEAPYGTVAEAVGGSYQWEYARIATFTGLPNVIGWPWHEVQWRGTLPDGGAREGDIKSLYETNQWEEAKRVLDAYHIRYVYIGGSELSTYRVIEEKFTDNLIQVFKNATVTIYEYVDPAQFNSENQ